MLRAMGRRINMLDYADILGRFGSNKVSVLICIDSHFHALSFV